MLHRRQGGHYSIRAAFGEKGGDGETNVGGRYVVSGILMLVYRGCSSAGPCLSDLEDWDWLLNALVLVFYSGVLVRTMASRLSDRVWD